MDIYFSFNVEDNVRELALDELANDMFTGRMQEASEMFRQVFHRELPLGFLQVVF